jgi:CRP-like cAMP-binding protein
MNDNPIDRLPFMSSFSPEEMDILRPLFHCISLPAGEVLFEQGDPAYQFYIVIEGEVLIQYKPEDGPALILTRVRKNGVVGWSAAIGSPTYTSSAYCGTETSLLCMRSEDLRHFHDQQPQIAHLLLERLAGVIADRLRYTHPEIMALLENGMHMSSVNF